MRTYYRQHRTRIKNRSLPGKFQPWKNRQVLYKGYGKSKKRRFRLFKQDHVWINRLNKAEVYPFLYRKWYLGRSWTRTTKFRRYNPIYKYKHSISMYHKIRRFSILDRLTWSEKNHPKKFFIKYFWKQKQGFLKNSNKKRKFLFKGKLKKSVLISLKNTGIKKNIHTKKNYRLRPFRKPKVFRRYAKTFYLSKNNKVNYVKFYFKLLKQKFMKKSHPFKKKGRRFRPIAYKSNGYVFFGWTVVDKRFGRRLKWSKILRKMKWRFRKRLLLKKKEYFLRIWKRNLKHKFRVSDKYLKHKSYLDHAKFFAHRLVQYIMSTGFIKYFKLGRKAILSHRIAVNNRINTDVNHVVKPFDTIHFQMPSKYLKIRSSIKNRYWKLRKWDTKKNNLKKSWIHKPWRRKHKWKKKYIRKNWFKRKGFLYNKRCRLLMCYKEYQPKNLFRIDHMPNYYNYKLLSLWK